MSHDPVSANWERERDRFIADDAADRTARHDEATGPVDDHGARLPLLGGEFAELARTLLAPEPVGPPDQRRSTSNRVSVLERVVELGRRIVPGADVVSITLRRQDEDGYTTPAETDPLATDLDHVQYRSGEGPCLTALERGGLGTAESSDLADDPQWSRFGPAAAGLGARSLFAVGLFPVGDPPVRGALNLYSRRRGRFSAIDRDCALLLAAHAAVALAHTRATEAVELARADLVRAREDLDTTKASRDVIGQAKGILMERQNLSAAEAFDTLRRASQDLNIKLRDVAETLVHHRADL